MDRISDDPRLLSALWTVIVGTAFPRVAYLLRWPTRLGPRGLALYIAFHTGLLFAIGRYLIPFLRKAADRQEQEPERRGRHQLPTVVLNEAVRRASATGSRLDLRDVVPEDWDRVVTFGGYSTGETVSNRLGFNWGEGFERAEIAHEAEAALVFLDGRKVAAWIAHFSRADLTCVAHRNGRTRATSRFYVESPERGYVLLIPAEDGRNGAAARACRRKVAGM